MPVVTHFYGDYWSIVFAQIFIDLMTELAEFGPIPSFLKLKSTAIKMLPAYKAEV